MANEEVVETEVKEKSSRKKKTVAEKELEAVSSSVPELGLEEDSDSAITSPELEKGVLEEEESIMTSDMDTTPETMDVVNEPVIGSEDDLDEGYMPNEGYMEENMLDEAAANELVKVLMNSGIFQKRRSFQATKEQRRKMYRRSEKVVAQKGQRVMTTEDHLKHEHDILLAATRSVPKTILYGEIVGVTENNEGVMCALVQLDDTNGMYRILIPALELFPLDLDNYTKGPEGLTYLKNEMRSRIGGHIGFTVYDLRENERTAYGSRVEAMAIEAYHWYRQKDAEGRTKMENGLRATAEIMSVRKDRVKVHVLGAEATILSKDMSWLSLGVLTEEFKIGQTIVVRVTNIKESEYIGADGRKHVLISISASKKDAELNPAELYYDQFQLGDIVMGTITNTDDPVGVFVNLQGKIDCLCHFPASGVPMRGRACVVEIIKKDDTNKYLYGQIRSMD